MTKQVLDDMKRMLDFRPDAILQMLQLFRQAAQFAFWQRLAFGAFHGHVPRATSPIFLCIGTDAFLTQAADFDDPRP